MVLCLDCWRVWCREHGLQLIISAVRVEAREIGYISNGWFSLLWALLRKSPEFASVMCYLCYCDTICAITTYIRVGWDSCHVFHPCRTLVRSPGVNWNNFDVCFSVYTIVSFKTLNSLQRNRYSVWPIWDHDSSRTWVVDRVWFW